MKTKARPGYERKSIARGSAWHWVKKKPAKKRKLTKKEARFSRTRRRMDSDHDFR